MRIHTAFATFVLAAGLVMPFPLHADEFAPSYSLDFFSHPYRFTPMWGHASQNPGSPKWFRPGYGYQVPGFGDSLRLSSPAALSYQTHPFGNRAPGELRIRGHQHHYWGSGPPWYLPGAPAAVNGTDFNW